MQRRTHVEGIIRPARGKREPHLNPVSLMVMLPAELHRLVRQTGAVELPIRQMPLATLYRIEGKALPSITLAGPFIGAPHAVMGLEKLIALGSRVIWVLGWCGSLQPDLRIGDLVIPLEAISEEGTSTHYPGGGKTARSDERLNRTLTSFMARRDLKSVQGTIWTTDAIYREIPEKVKRFQQLGVLAVEMEISALMTVAAYRCATLAALLVVSDELADLKWKPGFSDPRLKRSTRLAGDLLLDLAREGIATGPEA